MKKVTLKFRKKERGFTLIELLIVIAILGVLAAVVVPNVMGLFGKGGSQAYETDKSTIQTSVATFWGDVHVGPFDNDPAAGFDWRWGSTNAAAKPAGHYFPTEDGLASSIVANTAVTDSYGNPRMDIGAAAATDAQIASAAIWMGLLVNPAAAGADPGSDSRTLAAPLTDESDL
jgi:prepilin-type N-terminal cleavage/methylation domain-containing protein